MNTTIEELIESKEKIVSASEERLATCWIQSEPKVTVNQKPVARIGERIWQPTVSGELRARVIALFDSAKELVCASSFLVSDQSVVDAMIRASNRAVRVYLLTSEALLLKDVREDDEFDTKRLDEHKQILRSLAGRVLVRTSDNFHSKFVICDPLRPSARGMLLTANLNEEALVRNQEIAIELDEHLSNDLYRQFLMGFTLLSQNELLSPDNVGKARPFPKVTFSDPESILCTCGELHTLSGALEGLIKNARSQILLSTFGIEGTHDVSKILLQAAQQGKVIRILARPRDKKSNMEALISLAKAGVKIRAHRFLHGKSIVVDTVEGTKGIVMTANFEQQGLDKGFESGVLLEGKDAEDLRNLLENWWESAPYELALDRKKNQIQERMMLWEGDKLTEISIQKSYRQELGSLQANSFDEIGSLEPKSFPKPSLVPSNIMYLEYHYTWKILPPALPRDATQSKTEGDFPVYSRGNERYVLIKEKRDLQKAQDFANRIGAKVVVPSFQEHEKGSLNT